ncbi:hypothetical protein [Seonamhaeicola maritimus]|uniref:hypothetical protein n=1 Tax=Seonamhaeicola maritimus TaxID=2591822 RepID=UPI002495022E|nr:hypothetical protein [Seonamhaeicola maritimus]
MRKVILLFILIAFVSCKTIIIDEKDTVDKDGISYFKKDMKLVNGFVIGYFENGWLSYEGKYKGGKKVGVHKYWYHQYKFGDLANESIYKDGVIISEKTYYDDNQLWTEGTYKNGVEDGVHKGYYYKSGKLEYEQVWENGKLISVKNYDP